jgi:hypothetical protein
MEAALGCVTRLRQREGQGESCNSWVIWRRGGDSNPRMGYKPINGLANRRLQPLGHLS